MTPTFGQAAPRAEATYCSKTTTLQKLEKVNRMLLTVSGFPGAFQGEQGCRE
jgi:hypothetical protein